MARAADGDAYRPCAGIALFAPDGRVLIADRNDVPGPAWQLPQGGIDPGESPREAALRELAEELSVRSAEVVGESGWHAYDLPGGAGNRWGGRWRGQRIKVFACRFTGPEAEINVETEHPEFRAWKWTALESLPALIVAFKRPVYEAVVAELAPVRDAIVASGRPGGD